MRRFLILFVPLALIAGSAAAQNDPNDLSTRLDRLERDVTFVQKQVYRNESNSGGNSNASGATANTGPLQVRMSQIEEELRQIRGLIEQTQFQNSQTAGNLKKFSDDVDYRLRALEQAQQQAQQMQMSPAPVAEAAPVPPATVPAVAAAPGAPAAALTGKDFPDSNSAYSAAFRLMNEKRYAEAGAGFDNFVKKYPSDPLTSNAYYWLGETQFARKDYTRATESFRKGFEVNPDGQKAPDNLYKLAMSLAQIKRTNEACVVLSQVAAKYSESAARTVAKAEEARAQMQCKN
ncbi:MAG: tol-pal system protein YbgF [Rickettsiales bacterium]